MNMGIVVLTQHRLFALLIAATLALTAIVGPMAADQLAGTHLTQRAYACHGSSGGGC